MIASCRNIPVRCRIENKGLGECGRKRSEWKVATHELLVEEFTRRTATGIKVTRKLQSAAVVEHILNAENLDITEVEAEHLIIKYIILYSN